MDYDKIKFTGHLGYSLAARLDKPQGEIKAYALFAHCFTCGKDIVAASRIAKGLSEKGYAVLRFDFTGLGASEGEFSNTNFSSNVQDLVKAADYMREHLGAPSVLIGHSLGGAAVLSAAQYMPEVKAVSTVGAPSDIGNITRHFKDYEQDIMEHGEAEVQLAGRPFKIKKQFVEDVQKQNLKESIRNLGRALLVIHAPRDETVSIENAGKIFTEAKHPKSFISLDKADHLITNRADAQYAADIIAVWAARYI
jgi:alpha-beta hydrolase superfamily lysophospholipase